MDKYTDLDSSEGPRPKAQVQRHKYSMPEKSYKSFSEFWPFYVSEHSKSGTRLLHLIGTTLGIVVMIYFIAIGRWYLFLLGLIPGYACAWIAHFLIEKNKPATFQYPLWSLPIPSELGRKNFYRLLRRSSLAHGFYPRVGLFLP